jgi:hypothetical protein
LQSTKTLYGIKKVVLPALKEGLSVQLFHGVCFEIQINSLQISVEIAHVESILGNTEFGNETKAEKTRQELTLDRKRT